METQQLTWNKTNDYYNRDVVTQDIYSKQFPRSSGGKCMIYLIDRPNFMYTISCGANSDYSQSGSFYECSKIATVQDAMNALDVIIPLHLSGKDKEKRNFIDSLK